MIFPPSRYLRFFSVANFRTEVELADFFRIGLGFAFIGFRFIPCFRRRRPAILDVYGALSPRQQQPRGRPRDHVTDY